MKTRLRVGLSLLLLLPALWTLGAAWYAFGGGAAGWGAMAVFAGGHGVFLLRPRLRGWTWAWTVAGMVAAFSWFHLVTPSNDRDWRVEVSRMPTAKVEGDVAVVRNIRNFRYRTEDDFDPAWTDRTYDLRRLRGADLLMCHWDGNEDIAHTMLSFDFGEGEFLTLSVEVRREKGEDWGGLPGIYRQFEVLYILADERDVVNLRTGYRGEDLYLYRLRIPPADVRKYFERVLEHCNTLAREPAFYDTLDYNCSSSLARITQEIWPDRPKGPLTKILNGHADEAAWGLGYLNTDLPFPELKRRSAISARGKTLREDPEFSVKIREGMPLQGR